MKSLLQTFLLTSLIPFLAGAEEKTIQHLDLDQDSHRQVVVDREKGQYLGHPTTCLLVAAESFTSGAQMGASPGQTDSPPRKAGQPARKSRLCTGSSTQMATSESLCGRDSTQHDSP
jgi:hypothetical protein